MNGSTTYKMSEDNPAHAAADLPQSDPYETIHTMQVSSIKY
jgi:hypothetical protein